MDFPRPSVSPSNIIGDLKDRFGFGGANSQRSYDDEGYYDEYNDYGYDDDASYDANYDYDTQADPYDRLEYTTRPTAGRSSRASSYGSSTYTTSPHLVSSEDIRATTSAYGVSSAAAGAAISSTSYSAPRSTSSYASGSTTVMDPVESDQYDVPATSYSDFVSPYKEARQGSSASGISGSGAGVSSGRSSAGLDSLFTPSDGVASGASAAGAAGSTEGTAVSASRFANVSGESVVSGSAFSAVSADHTSTATSGVASASTEALSGVSAGSVGASGSVGSYGSSSGLSSREITLLQPVSYDDVASVARSVKKGNIVVLSLRSTDSALSKRVLDFSFGVASALDARIDCVADKTFVMVQGKELSLEEHHRLQKQGIL